MGCGISQSQVSEKQLHQPPQTKSATIHSPVARSNQNNRMGVAMAGVGVGVGEANLKSLRHTVKPQTGGSGAEKEDEEQFTMVMPSANEGGLNPSSNPNMSLKSGFGGGQSMNNSFAVGGSVGSVSGVPFKGFGFAPVAGAQQQSSGRPKSTSDGNMDEEAKSVAFYCPPGVPELLVAANGPNTQHGAAEVSAP